jgi:hypothetical protein
MSSGESVPEVITTLRKRSKTGRIASDASLQHSRSVGSGTPGTDVLSGSNSTVKPAPERARQLSGGENRGPL